MSVVINTNSDALRIQNVLTNATNKLSQTMQRMSSGMKINSAKDDAAGTVISARMAVQLDGNKICQQNVQNANSLLSTAEGNIDVVLDNITRIRDLTLQAKNGTYSDAEKAAMQSEVSERIAEINRVSDSAKFSQLQLFGGDLGTNGVSFQVGANATQNDTLSIDASKGVFSSVKFNDLLTTDEVEEEFEYVFKASQTSDVLPDPAADTYKVGDSLLVNSTSQKAMYVVKEDENGKKQWVEDSQAYVEANYKGKQDKSSYAAASHEGEVIQHTDGKYYVSDKTNWVALDDIKSFDTEKDYSFKGAAEAKASTELTITHDKKNDVYTFTNLNGEGGGATAKYAKDDILYYDGDFYKCTTATELDGSNDVTKASQWKKLDKYEGEFKGTVNGKSTIPTAAAANKGQVYKVENDDTEDNNTYWMSNGSEWVKVENYQEPVKEEETSRAIYGDANPFDLTTMNQDDFVKALTALDSAIDDLTSRKSSIGSYESRLESALSTLTTQYTNLTSAKSIITDADIASEASQYTQNQILQQVSTSLLAQANQAPSIALSLL